MLAYSTITGRLTGAFVDSNTNSLVPLTGKVTLVPFAKSIHSLDGSDPVTVLPAKTIIDIGENGVLPSTRVVATDSPDTTPTDWTYQVFFDLKLDGRAVPYEPFHFHAPANTTVNLATVAPVDEYQGVAITRGKDGSSPIDYIVEGTIMTILHSDGTSHVVDLPVLNPGEVVVIDGEDGRGILTVTGNGDSTITINFDDGTVSEPITIPTVQGPPGPQGEPGIAGPKGDTGERGLPGETGPQGLPGPKGDKGDTGADSQVPGPQGEIGPQGPIGPKGDTGAASTVPGPEGPVGPVGPQGIPGERGPIGLTGEKGDTGPAGTNGVMIWVGPATDNPDPAIYKLHFVTP